MFVVFISHHLFGPAKIGTLPVLLTGNIMQKQLHNFRRSIPMDVNGLHSDRKSMYQQINLHAEEEKL
jgi:hypothetical protein